MNTPTKLRKANGSLAFPEGFKQIKRSVQSKLNPNLETCLFSFKGKEYNAESYSGIVLREMGWKDFDKEDKERISLYWVDQVIHGVNGVLWSPGGFEDDSSYFGYSLNLFKPTFSPPHSMVLSNGDVKVTYWYSDLKNKNVKYLQVIFDTNGDIKSRDILSTSKSQFYKGLATSVFGSVALAVGIYCKYLAFNKNIDIMEENENEKLKEDNDSHNTGNGNSGNVNNNNNSNNDNNLVAPTPPVAVKAAIRVVCRVRPLTELEISRNERSIVFFHNSNSISIRANGQPFTFDRIFNCESTQLQVFQDVAEPIINDFLNGYHGTIMAYGQTASGKTFTMVGDPAPSLHGIIPRVIEKIFEGIKSLRGLDTTLSIAFCLKISALELYNEKLYDLYDGERNNLSIREHKQNGIYVEGITEKVITSVEEAYDFLNASNRNRAIAATKMSAASSRSHSVLMIELSQQNLSAESSKISKLFLVDLAGSERAHKTGAEGDRMQEAKNINLSLSALGKVINALTTGAPYIPYRDSKLTRVLQDSLGGNSKTSLIINCSPSRNNEHETISTLQFGTRAKSIENVAKVNKKITYRELEEYIIKLSKELERLRKESNEKDATIITKDQEIEGLKKELQEKSSSNLDDLYFSKIQLDQAKIFDDNIEEFKVDENNANNNNNNSNKNNNNINIEDLDENPNNSSHDSIKITDLDDPIDNGPDEYIHDIIVNGSIHHDSDKSSDDESGNENNSSLNRFKIQPLFNESEIDQFNNSHSSINNFYSSNNNNSVNSSIHLNLKVSTSYITTSPNISPRTFDNNYKSDKNNIDESSNNNNTASPTLSFFSDQFLSLSSSVDGGKILDSEKEPVEQEISENSNGHNYNNDSNKIEDLPNNIVGEDLNQVVQNQEQIQIEQVLQEHQENDDEISISSVVTSKSLSTVGFTFIEDDESQSTTSNKNKEIDQLDANDFENDSEPQKDENENTGNNGNIGEFNKSSIEHDDDPQSPNEDIEIDQFGANDFENDSKPQKEQEQKDENENSDNNENIGDNDDFGFSKIEKDDEDNPNSNDSNSNIINSNDNGFIQDNNNSDPVIQSSIATTSINPSNENINTILISSENQEEPLPQQQQQFLESNQRKRIPKSFYMLFSLLLLLVSLVYFINTPSYQDRLIQRRTYLDTLGIYSDFPTFEKLGIHKKYSMKFFNDLYGYNSQEYQKEASDINTSYNHLVEMSLFENTMSYLLHSTGFRLNDDLSFLNRKLEYKSLVYKFTKSPSTNNHEQQYQQQLEQYQQEINNNNLIKIKDEEILKKNNELKNKDEKIQMLEKKNNEIMEKLKELETIITKKGEDQDYQKTLIEKVTQLESEKKKFVSLVSTLESDKKTSDTKINQMNDEILTLKSESQKYQIVAQPPLLKIIWEYINPKNILDFLLSFF
ncbi:hypothetical protein DICPUDRAFT_146808 [Dictyostelium purpureum]|uniref:Kinesin motor domain-containing protein n=1 Tax=Dictyostelium purpureum TaxID=5786 RepID=F0Z6Y2_DICPU|nr:uncharacterized protein DICPUDRAFT_146808 [Dictyostelium purpureum]EGC40234.1 hypothetical protein DICPUDRAFT_146808 [Dictyostelium purpureum]|eukprot:XP_003283170.1 hypothetical protein DICPUDRAFT_146808 [Dictyostelium purpureum]